MENTKCEKHKIIDIEEDLWKQSIKNTYDGIVKKLQSARKLLEFDKDISAGLYTYAMEEFGKIILLKDSHLLKNSSKRKIEYSKQFACHKAKFKAVIDYLVERNQQKCLILNNEGNFIEENFDLRNFGTGLIADFQARLSIFYSDFEYSKHIGIKKVPIVDESMLKDAIGILENVVDQFYKSM